MKNNLLNNSMQTTAVQAIDTQNKVEQNNSLASISTEQLIQTILLIDDNSNNISIIVNILKQEYKVITTSPNDVSYDRLKELKVDLILLDVIMPKMCGFDLCVNLKLDEKIQDIPVIFISALTTLEDKLKGFDVGATDYISKPINPNELLSKVENELKSTSEEKKQKHNLAGLTKNMKTSGVVISEMESISNYFMKLLSIDSVDKVLYFLIELLRRIKLNAIVALELPNKKNKKLSTGETISILAISILEKARENNKSLSLNNKLVLHKEHLTVLITNIPSNDKVLCERINNNLQRIVKGTNLALTNLLYHQNKIVEKSLENPSSTDVLNRTESILSMVEKQLQLITEKNQQIIGDLIDNVNHSFMGLGLSESQEDKLINLIEKAENKVLSVTKENYEIKNKIALAKNLLKL